MAIEGTDGVGKTSLTREITFSLKSPHIGKECILLDEFSSSPIGRALSKIIEEKTFFMLGDGEHYPISETLALCSDYIFQVEKITREKRTKDYLVSDRGILSFLVYQGIRLRDSYGRSFKWNDWMNSVFAPIPKPDLTICITSPVDQIRRRLEKRGDAVTTNNLKTIVDFQKEFLKILRNQDSNSYMIVENLDGKLNEVSKLIVNKILTLSK